MGVDEAGQEAAVVEVDHPSVTERSGIAGRTDNGEAIAVDSHGLDGSARHGMDWASGENDRVVHRLLQSFGFIWVAGHIRGSMGR